MGWGLDSHTGTIKATVCKHGGNGGLVNRDGGAVEGARQRKLILSARGKKQPSEIELAWLSADDAVAPGRSDKKGTRVRSSLCSRRARGASPLRLGLFYRARSLPLSSASGMYKLAMGVYIVMNITFLSFVQAVRSESVIVLPPLCSITRSDVNGLYTLLAAGLVFSVLDETPELNWGVLLVACSCAGYVEPLDDDVEIVVPEDDHGLYAIDILDPSWFVELLHLSMVYHFHDMIDMLINCGYEKGTTLFGYGYDFRQSNRIDKAMAGLKSKLETAYKTSGGKKEKVTIISHSMGRLLVRCFMSMNHDVFAKYVNKWICIACLFQDNLFDLSVPQDASMILCLRDCSLFMVLRASFLFLVGQCTRW
nr:unnamed protein product [Digitaria exilis]